MLITDAFIFFFAALCNFVDLLRVYLFPLLFLPSLALSSFLCEGQWLVVYD